MPIPVRIPARFQPVTKRRPQPHPSRRKQIRTDNRRSRCAQRRARIPNSRCWRSFRDCDDPIYTSIACLSWSAPTLSAAAITSLGRLPRCRSTFARSRSNRGMMLGAGSILFSKQRRFLPPTPHPACPLTGHSSGASVSGSMFTG